MTGNLFSIGATGVNTFKKALDVTSQNITNSSTPGYSRQVTEISSLFYQTATGGVIGTGVQIAGIERMFDQFIAGQARSYLCEHEQYLTYRQNAEDIDNLLSNTSSNVSKSLQNFFNGIQTLESNPSDSATRKILLQNSNLLSQMFNNIYSKLSKEANQVNSQISEIVGNINSIASQVAGLNKDILFSSNNSNASTPPNALLDQREYLLDQLGELIQFTVNEQTDGSYDVIMTSGVPLVFGTNMTTLTTQSSPKDPAVVSVGEMLGNRFEEFDQTSLGGQLGGLVDFRTQIIFPAMSQLGMIGAGLIQSVNAQHAKGVDLNGNLGGLFFNDINGLGVQLSRSISNANNNGTAAFAVSISTIDINQASTNQVSGAAGILTPAATGLIPLGSTDLTINGIAISASSSDGVSTSQASASALAIANAINLKTAQTGVTAYADPNVVNMGTFTVGATALSGTNLVINGSNIVPATNTLSDLVVSINALAGTTGVTAEVNAYNELVLNASDGRNIEISTDGTAPAGAAFSHFSLGSAADDVIRASVHLESSSSITIGGSLPSHAGFTAGTSPSLVQNLTGSDYSLIFDGTNYNLTRLSDNELVASQMSSTFHVDGLDITLNNGTPVAGDEFLLIPTRNLANTVELALTSTTKLALASPVLVDFSHDINQGTGVPQLDAVLNTSGSPTSTTYVYGNAFDPNNPKTLSPPIQIEFFEVNGNPVYRLYDISQGVSSKIQIGTDYNYMPGQKNSIFPAPGVLDRTPPGTNATYSYDPGYRVSFTGVPKPGDVFTISYNENGVGDPTNAQLMGNLQNQNFLGTNNTTFQGSYVTLTSFIGTNTQSAQVGEESLKILMEQAQDRQASVSGVNLDEELANLIFYQEAYQASARVISTANTIFNALLSAFS